MSSAIDAAAMAAAPGPLGPDDPEGTGVAHGQQQWALAMDAAAIAATDPIGTGGVILAGAWGPQRTAWLAAFRALAGDELPLVKIPGHVSDDRLVGGLDLSATLAKGRPVIQSGLLARADGGVILLSPGERVGLRIAGQIAAARDCGGVHLQRDGADRFEATRFGVIACDEALAGEDGLATVLGDRIGMRVVLDGLTLADAAAPPRFTRDDVVKARARYARVEAPASVHETLAAITVAFGIGSLRVAVMALSVARAHAALEGRDWIAECDVMRAASLCLTWRATQIPNLAPPDDCEQDDITEPPPADNVDDPPEPPEAIDDPARMQMDSEQMIEAMLARLPPELLAQLANGVGAMARGPQTDGRVGASRQDILGRTPAGIVRGDPRSGARLSVFATLLAAAPKQTLRRGVIGVQRDRQSPVARRLQVRPDDFRIVRKRRQQQSLTIFAVDASGSAALARLGEAKGAVELLLADCYVRRDQVALLAFRGAQAEVLLSPTSALARAKRALSVLPGGGGTPLAAGIAKALQLAHVAQTRGQVPQLVFLTDGRANVGLDGAPGRKTAMEDAMAQAAQLKALRLPVLMIDTAPRPDPRASALAAAMGGRYLALPSAQAEKIRDAVAASAPG